MQAYLGGIANNVTPANNHLMIMVPNDAIEMGRVLIQTGLATMKQNGANLGTDRPDLKDRLVDIACRIAIDLDPEEDLYEFKDRAEVNYENRQADLMAIMRAANAAAALEVVDIVVKDET